MEVSRRWIVCCCASSGAIVDSGLHTIMTDLEFKSSFFALLLMFGDS